MRFLGRPCPGVCTLCARSLRPRRKCRCRSMITLPTHHLAGLADIAELLRKLQQANLGTDDLLFSRRAVSSNCRGGALRHPDRSAP